MERRTFLRRSALAALTVSGTALGGCRAHQYGHLVAPEQQDLVGSHTAGAAAYNQLIDQAVAQLLARQQAGVQQVSHAPGPIPPRRICFVCVENSSAEELGDFKEQIYEQIDSQILASGAFESVSRRFVDAGLRETRLRPDALFLPENMRMFASVLEQQGQPFDYLLYAKLTSGTTERNDSYQRDYVLTLEMIDVHTGRYDKESAKIRKGYHKTRVGKWRMYNPFSSGT
jgi:hypothetical protein